MLASAHRKSPVQQGRLLIHADLPVAGELFFLLCLARIKSAFKMNGLRSRSCNMFHGCMDAWMHG
jgi:hypothetical protein